MKILTTKLILNRPNDDSFVRREFPGTDALEWISECKK